VKVSEKTGAMVTDKEFYMPVSDALYSSVAYRSLHCPCYDAGITVSGIGSRNNYSA
jgi:hypothetical protein